MPACPALFVSAPASGQGKTSVTAGLARLHRRLGRRVRVFKTGPDFLDPMLLERASGAPVHALDLGMVGEAGCRALLADAARDADLILIEGVMGLFDGTPSSADLAAAFGVPVVAVISAKAMAQTFAAIAFGLARFRPGLPFHGVLANRVGSARHAELLQQALPGDLRWLGHVPADAGIALPERHLGLHQPADIDDLDARLDRAADVLAQTALAELPPAVAFAEPDASAPLPRALAGKRIAVARDVAFSFIYPANLALLDTLGAELRFFSPLADEAVPDDCDALFLPGGYPELHARTLAANAGTARTIRAHAAAGRPIVAECGGMVYLCESLTDVDGVTTPMLGLLPGHATMQRRFAALGMQQLDTRNGPMRGHTFHYSRLATSLEPVAYAARPDGAPGSGEAVYRHGAIAATYMHVYWPSNPDAAVALFGGEAF
ncbi:MAG: cobyrinate a,c-diamide synthase [Burkholderia sp.]|uniref:cobyrinate a,c-diamide synthase n=2 Tax=Burkholderia sp. TaxID=36773 RepID=UPI00258B3A7B|nr:cobyrinate a,c-diamide synthase [Burkholderia sp.]MCA3780038.1 cobyrinate a,c-diamide synthase [Burkholderia sp.]MCA3793611.1 cobyrinate a,c-diamide synthase [Burkholderia sp.]MCA3803366.1 cobyrinate a,c-diamide synthase [Burkholderia sp.]MCA3814161.1 cobyrinate a,c-diamide synthase [Burkholderia sp.]MCA3819020.1 cobyrinate a,c-diamide synthase [Burkholderia sp.]